jgi:hypothetical protein
MPEAVKLPAIPILAAILAAVLIVAAGVYFTLLSGSLQHADNPSCTASLDGLDTDALYTAEIRCRYAYNMRLFNDEMSFNSWTYAHRSASLTLQLFSTALLLAVVVLIVFFGLAMSYLEFRKGTDSSATIKLGPAHLEVSSSVIGIVILTLSLAFAFLYFDKAYSISEIGSGEPGSSDAAGSDSAKPPPPAPVPDAPATNS